MFGQVVIGPPGSGKTTYCKGMQSFFKEIGRKVAVVNLDPANDDIPYDCTINIAHLVTLEDVMDNLHLGPNGGLIYCMEFLEKNVDWLLKELQKYKDHFILFDFPGQVELYTHHDSVKNVLNRLIKDAGISLCAVHLVDSHYCTDPTKFIAVLMTSLCTMMQMALPHINVLSKVDLIEKQDKQPHFNLDYYTEVQDLSYLLGLMDDDPFAKKYKMLNESLCEFVQDRGMVSFWPLNIEDKESIYTVLKEADKANGYVYGPVEERTIASMMAKSLEQAGIEF